MATPEPVAVTPQGVLAVVVVYETGLDRVAPWPALCAARSAHRREGDLVLERVLVYDNSKTPRVLASELPPWARCVHDPANGGTAAAYACALREAQDCGLPWLLLLDDDTSLPADLLARAADALRRADPQHVPAVVLPRVLHGEQPVSPSQLSWSGSLRPLARDQAAHTSQAITGIASGALVQVAACQALDPWPAGLWLDYVDHWLFTSLRRRGFSVLVSDAVLAHDLSVNQPRRLSAARLASVLRGEQIFARTLPWPARLMRPLRLMWRAVRISPLGLDQRAHIVGHLLLGRSGRRG